MSTITETDNLPASQVRQDASLEGVSFLAALVTGELAAFVTAAAYISIFVSMGQDAFFPLRVIGSAVFGDAALQRLNGTAAFTGFILHFTVATLPWVFAFYYAAKLTRARRLLHFLVIGIAITVVSELLDAYFVVPVLMRALHGHDIYGEHITKPISWMGHIIFGMGFAFAPYVERALEDMADRMCAR